MRVAEALGVVDRGEEGSVDDIKPVLRHGPPEVALAQRR
jgi:hypothetical protein